MKKVMDLKAAIGLIEDGNMLAFGGNVLHRAPMAAVREITRQNKRNLKLVKTAGAHDIDLLCAMDCVQSVDAGFISYETKYGLATHYRKGIQSGNIIGNEHACYTVICALRAASMNVPFMPVRGLNAGDLLVKNDYFVVVEDPFSGDPITLVKSLVPDVAIIHVQECDAKGNSVIFGPKFEDVLLSRAAKKVIITTEQIVPESKTKLNADRVDIPGFLVTAVVHAPKGATPTSCYKKYEIDDKALSAFISLKSKEEIAGFVKNYEIKDYAGERGGSRL